MKLEWTHYKSMRYEMKKQQTVFLLAMLISCLLLGSKHKNVFLRGVKGHGFLQEKNLNAFIWSIFHWVIIFNRDREECSRALRFRLMLFGNLGKNFSFFFLIGLP